MNRRDFLKRISAAGIVAAVVPELLVPERRVWALDRTMTPPPRLAGDDTAWLQWHIDHARKIPTGSYRTLAPLIVTENGVLNVTESRFRYSAPVAFDIRRPLRADDAFSHNWIVPDSLGESSVGLRFLATDADR